METGHAAAAAILTPSLRYAVNEASRLRQFTAQLMVYWEQLRSIKRYRTPQTTRAFSRIYALLHPLFMG